MVDTVSDGYALLDGRERVENLGIPQAPSGAIAISNGEHRSFCSGEGAGKGRGTVDQEESGRGAAGDGNDQADRGGISGEEEVVASEGKVVVLWMIGEEVGEGEEVVEWEEVEAAGEENPIRRRGVLTEDASAG